MSVNIGNQDRGFFEDFVLKVSCCDILLKLQEFRYYNNMIVVV